MKKPIVVTGIAGFIGSNVARRLIADGETVVGVDDLSGGKRSNVPREAEFIEGDLADARTIERFPRQAACVLHLAGQSSGEISFDDPVKDLEKNVVSTLRLIRWAIDHGARRMVYASSMSVYGPSPDRQINEDDGTEPLSCYGVGKLAAERYLRIYSPKLPYVAMRMFNVYGPGQDMANMRQGMVSIYLAMALRGGKVHVKGSFERFRDFIFIDDVVEAWVRAARLTTSESYVMNLGTGVRTTVGSLLEQIGQLVPGAAWYSEGGTPGDQFGIYADMTRVRSVLGLGEFTRLQAGLARFVEWARPNV